MILLLNLTTLVNLMVNCVLIKQHSNMNEYYQVYLILLYFLIINMCF